MRTTVDLADDVRAEVERWRRERSLGLSEALNELARAGITAAKQPREPFQTDSAPMGPFLVDVNNAWKAIEAVEGSGHK